MKNRRKRLAACLILLLLPLAACREAKESSAASNETASALPETESAAPAESEAESGSESSAPEESAAADASSAPEEEKAATVEDFIASEEVQAELDSVQESFADSPLSIAVEAEGEKMVWSFRYDDLLDEDAEALGAALQEALDADSMKEVFGDIAAALRDSVASSEAPGVVVRYLAPDGSVLAQREYAPTEETTEG